LFLLRQALSPKKALLVCNVLAHQPSPDWKGPPEGGLPEAMEAEAGTLESGIKYPPWHFIPQVFWRKLASYSSNI